MFRLNIKFKDYKCIYCRYNFQTISFKVNENLSKTMLVRGRAVLSFTHHTRPARPRALLPFLCPRSPPGSLDRPLDVPLKAHGQKALGRMH